MRLIFPQRGFFLVLEKYRNDALPMTTVQRIRQLRIDRKLSQKQLADELGLTRQAVNGWENDKGLPHWANLGQLADYFRVSVQYLLYGSNTNAKDVLPPTYTKIPT